MSESKDETQEVTAPKAEKPASTRCAVASCRKMSVRAGLCDPHWRSAAGAN